MGATRVTVAISNPTDPNRRWEGLFLVDAGAIDCMAPAKHLHAICIEPRGKRTYELADGSEIVMEIGVAGVEFMGEVVGDTIIFGQDDIEPILGATALESVGIEADPQNQRLNRLPAVRLKQVFRHTDTIVVAGRGNLNRDVPTGTQNAILRQAGLKWGEHEMRVRDRAGVIFILGFSW